MKAAPQQPKAAQKAPEPVKPQQIQKPAPPAPAKKADQKPVAAAPKAEKAVVAKQIAAPSSADIASVISQAASQDKMKVPHSQTIDIQQSHKDNEPTLVAHVTVAYELIPAA